MTRRPLLLTLCALIALPASPALAQAPLASPDFSAALSGTPARPLTVKLTDLDTTWRQMVVTKASGFDLLTLLSVGGTGRIPKLDIYYTHGETTTIGSETFLVAYHRLPTAAELDSFGSGDSPAPPPAGITLSLSLINIRQIASLDGIQPVTPQTQASVQAQTAHEAQQASLTNLKQIGLAMIQYTQDWDEHFPPMQSTATAKNALLPYAKNDAVFQNPNTHAPYRPNTSLSGQSLAFVDSPSALMAYYDDGPDASGQRGVLFADGHAKLVPEDEWRRLKAASHLPPPSKDK